MALTVRQVSRPLLTVKVGGPHISEELAAAPVRVGIQANRSDWEFLSGLAADVGFVLQPDGDKLHFGPPAKPSAAPSRRGFDADSPLELVWGDNLIRLAAAVSSDSQVKEVVVRGW